MRRRAIAFASGATAVLLAGCGGSGFNPNASPGKTRFALAQFVEERVADLRGPYQGSDAVMTICGLQPQTHSRWFCDSEYVPASGIVTSVGQDAANTNVAYDTKLGKFVFSSADAAAGRGVTGQLTPSTLRILIREDGDKTGIASSQDGRLQLTRGEVAKQSESTLATLAPLLTPAGRAELAQARQNVTGGSGARTPPQTSSTPSQTSTATPPTSSASTSQPAQTSTGSTSTPSETWTTPVWAGPCGVLTDGAAAGVAVTMNSGVTCSEARPVVKEWVSSPGSCGTSGAAATCEVLGFVCTGMPHGAGLSVSCVDGDRKIKFGSA